MKSSDVPVIFRQKLLANLALYGYPDVLVIEADQPTKQGRVDDGIYWRLLNPKNYGWQSRNYNYNPGGNGHTEHQLFETMMQLTCFVHDDTVTGYDSTDLANVTKMIVQSLPFVTAMKISGVGVQRASASRTITFTDEADNYAKEVSFDVNLTFMQTINPQTPTVEILEPHIMRI